MTNKIFRVVDIPSEFDLVINAGQIDGICEGMDFDVFEYGKEIIDPETNESLGTLDIIKATVEVIHVFPKICQCRKITYDDTPVFPILNTLPNTTQIVPHKHKLNVDYASIVPNIPVDTTIKIGDKARLKD